MIFVLQYALIVGGYAATAFLLGNYMKEHAGATDIDLGFIFMIQPAVIVVRPFACSLADKYQSHRTLYLYCSLVSVLTHIPFILVPLAKQYHILDERLFTERTRFWLLVGCHFIGCICFCCMRTLGDVLTVNYCKRIGSNYTTYRKYGPISFGICSLALGYVNISDKGRGTFSAGLPDYVPGFILYTSCHFILALLFYVWPPEYFVIYSDAQLDELRQDTSIGKQLPTRGETWRHIKTKLLPVAGWCNLCRSSKSLKATTTTSETEGSEQQANLGSQVGRDDQRPALVDSKQQLRIMLVLMRQDVRIPLFLLILVFCGIVGHSIQNFVYVYLHSICEEQHHRPCNSSTLSGCIMAGICVTETLAYLLVSWCAPARGKLIKIQLALFTLAVHYLILAHLVQASPYYFLIESVHGFEFGLMVATSIECGDLFANEVDLIVPELMRRNIVTPRDNLDLIRVSLVATMIACFLLVYDGLGGVIGSLLYGLVVNHFGYRTAFRLNAGLTILIFATILCGTLLTRLLRIRPKILQDGRRAGSVKQIKA